MALDVPTVVYGKKKDKKGFTQEEFDDLQRRWKERQERKKREGDKVSLDEFLGTNAAAKDGMPNGAKTDAEIGTQNEARADDKG